LIDVSKAIYVKQYLVLIPVTFVFHQNVIN